MDSRGAAEWVRNRFWPLWWRVSLSIKLYTTLNHIRFVFYHNIKEMKSLSWQLNTSTRIWKCTRCIMQMSRLYASDSFKTFCKLASYAETIRKNAWEKSNDAYSISIRVHTTKNHISIYFLPQYQRQRKWFFFQSASWKRHWVTHWREQRGRDSYLPRKISQSDCEISSNCGKIVLCPSFPLFSPTRM